MNWCKVDAALDMNPKIRKAGRAGREVFLFILRRRKMRDSGDSIPVADIDPDYLSDVLMMPVTEARDAVTAIRDASLVRIEGELCVLLGFREDWSGTPMSPRERKAKSRESKRKAPDVTESHEPIVTGHGCHAVEKSREEKKEEESGKPDVLPGLETAIQSEAVTPDPVRLLAEMACAEINRLTGSAYKPETAATVDLCRALWKAKHTTDEVKLVVADKVREWRHSPEFRKRLCPGTLLALKNFRRYLDELRSRPGARASPTPVAPTPYAGPPVNFLSDPEDD